MGQRSPGSKAPPGGSKHGGPTQSLSWPHSHRGPDANRVSGVHSPEHRPPALCEVQGSRRSGCRSAACHCPTRQRSRPGQRRLTSPLSCSVRCGPQAGCRPPPQGAQLPGARASFSRAKATQRLPRPQVAATAGPRPHHAAACLTGNLSATSFIGHPSPGCPFKLSKAPDSTRLSPQVVMLGGGRIGSKQPAAVPSSAGGHHIGRPNDKILAVRNTGLLADRWLRCTPQNQLE
ncbi:hypothetical protein NDU88_002723 [Pleurodeles waltl]|uniref:Uncharacterized protein n=1 Tax=Pleurodeles waltl TaxID=8319 RepID=A0AAV7T4H3_PLEWA|nr:hypothetical protein NDU88_002723 [Pleurodeles waltl]